jgi:hypothetical protein
MCDIPFFVNTNKWSTKLETTKFLEKRNRLFSKKQVKFLNKGTWNLLPNQCKQGVI